MAIEVLKPGLLSTLQGASRPGYRKLAVGPGGVMDEFAWRTGCYLAGNSEPVISLEYFHPGPVLKFSAPSIISITGPECSGILDGAVVPGWHPLLVKAGSLLELPPSPSGRCGYLNIFGGFRAAAYLGSGSTSLASGAGGHEGMKLAAGDVLEPETDFHQAGNNAVLGWTVTGRDLMLVYGEEKHLSLLPAPESSLLDEQTRQDISLLSFTIDPASNRMGYRLRGAPLNLSEPIELVSSPVDLGIVQLLPDGQLIVLMADHQTTGGYPRIGCVAHADLPRLVQSVQRRSLFFSWCTPETAYRLSSERERRLSAIRMTCLLNIKPYL